jgi:uncharacterized phage infection (PIP) family protein YhgE
MTRTPFRRLATAAIAAGLIAGLTMALATPAGAEEAPAGLDQLKARANEKVNERLAHLDTLDGTVAGAPADCGHNAELRSQLAADKTGLAALNATIQAETDRANTIAEYQQIFTDYRVYWLETPKTRGVVACARTTKAGSMLTALHDKIQARVDEAKAAGKDVSAAQAALDDMTAKIASASTSANQADDTVIALHADKGDREVLAANRSALQASRTSLRSAFGDLQAARADARTAIDAIKSA